MARGPAYPYVGLQQAVELSKKMYNFAKRTPALPDAVIKEAWGYSPTSSSGQKVLAALRYFGLVEDVDVGEARQIKISDRAYRILVDSADSPDRKKALQDAVLAPKAYAYCWKKWDGETPPAMRSHLIFDQGFNEGTIDAFLRDYKTSIQFAGLTKGTAIEGMADEETVEDSQIEKTSEGVESSKDSKAKIETAIRQAEQAGGIKMWNEVFNLPEGAVTIQIPASLSAESFEDLEAGLELFKRKIRRMVAKNRAETEQLPRDGLETGDNE
jgi:hypothetical protein